MGGAPDYDLAGALWNTNTPMAPRVPPDALAPLLAIAPDAPVLLDAVYADQDRGYLDARALHRLATNSGQSPFDPRKRNGVTGGFRRTVESLPT